MAIKAQTNKLIRQEIITGTLEELNEVANGRVLDGYELITATMVRMDSYNGTISVFYVWAKSPNLK